MSGTLRWLWVSLGVLTLLAWALLRPIVPSELDSHARPAADYAAAISLLDSLRAGDDAAIAADCGTTLYTHGGRTGRVVVLLHGLTNCPAQFDSVGRMLFAGGANVLIPRLPHHGYADRMTTELARVEARELCAFTDRVLDVASGLGDSVTVAGLSIGGVLAGWAGQERQGLERAVMIAPIFGVARAPGRWTPAVTRLALALPNTFIWWDGDRKQDLPGPRHVYPRFSTRSVAATLYVGAATRAGAARHAPAARELALVTVGGDEAADNAMAQALMDMWRAHEAGRLGRYEFPAALRLNHDVVDPEQVGGNPALTYPVLVAHISGAAAPSH